MKAVMKNVQVLSIEKNDFMGKSGEKVYLSNVYLYDEGETKVMELTIRDNPTLAEEIRRSVKRASDIVVDVRPQKGQYSYFVNVVGISKNGNK